MLDLVLEVVQEAVADIPDPDLDLGTVPQNHDQNLVQSQRNVARKNWYLLVGHTTPGRQRVVHAVAATITNVAVSVEAHGHVNHQRNVNLLIVAVVVHRQKSLPLRITLCCNRKN